MLGCRIRKGVNLLRNDYVAVNFTGQLCHGWGIFQVKFVFGKHVCGSGLFVFFFKSENAWVWKSRGFGKIIDHFCMKKKNRFRKIYFYFTISLHELITKKKIL